MQWNREDLGWSRNETVDVQLFGYYEDDDGPHWDFLQVLKKKHFVKSYNINIGIKKKTIGDRVINNGYYEFSIEKNWAVEQNRARRYRMGAVAVALLSGGTVEPK